MICEYDVHGWRGCLVCKNRDCIRDDIKHDDVHIDEEVKAREKYRLTYERTDAAYKERLRRKKLGLQLPEKHYKFKGREAEYQREYRANMPQEQRERYNARQREYIREKRARMKNVPVSIMQG